MAYFAITSIAVIGLYVAYVAPVFLRLQAGDKFQDGPWSLGRWSRPIGLVATIWVVFIFTLFMLPQALPVNINTFNYPRRLPRRAWRRSDLVFRLRQELVQGPQGLGFG